MLVSVSLNLYEHKERYYRQQKGKIGVFSNNIGCHLCKVRREVGLGQILAVRRN